MIAEGRAQGDYIARTYDIAEESTDRACRAALELFADRCWNMGGLMERIIGMDHLDGVVGRFYSGPAATRWRADFAELRRRTNLDLVDKLTEVIALARAASSLDNPDYREEFGRLRQRERESRIALLRECDRLRTALDSVVLPGIGAARDPELRLTKRGLARHAAAVALAFSVAAGTACKVDNPPATPNSTKEDPDSSMLVNIPPMPADDASVVDASLPASEPVDAAPADAGKPPKKGTKPKKPSKPPKKPKVIDHDGISEFAAPPLQKRQTEPEPEGSRG
jgi:hypothetical protein